MLAASLVLFVLVAGIIGTTWGMFRATKAEADAKREAGEKSEALATATANEIQAKTAQKDAQENLKDALAAVETMLTRVAVDRLQYVPQMEPIRRDLLLDALKFYQKFLDKQSDDPGIRREVTLAHRRVGQIHSQLGKYQDAERAYRNAMEMFDRLGPSAFADRDLLREMVNSQVEFGGWTLTALGKREEAVQNIRRAVELADKLDKEAPGNRPYILNARNTWAGVLSSQQPEEAEKILKGSLALGGDASSLGGVHRGLGGLFMSTGRLPQAEEAYRQAVKYAEQYAREHPSANWVQWNFATDKRNLAGVISANQRPAEAEEIQRSALVILDKLAIDFPAGPGYRAGLAEAQAEHAGMLKKLDRPADAEKALRRAIHLYEKLAADFPTMPAYWQTAFDQRLNLGQFLVEAGRTEDALDLYRQAVDLPGSVAADAPTKLNHWQGLVRTHVELGRLLAKTGKKKEAEAAYREAIAIHGKLQSQFSNDPVNRRDLARSHVSTAQALLAAGLHQEADKLYDWAFGLFDKLVADSPDAADYRIELLRTQIFNWGNPLHAAGRLDEAEKAFRQIQELAGQLAAKYPGVAEYRLQLAHSHNGLGHTLWNKRQAQEGLKECRAAVELFEKLTAEFPKTAEYRFSVANCHSQQGGLFALNNRPREAAEAYRLAIDAFEKLAAEFPNQPSYRAEIGWTCRKLASLLARQPNRGPEAEEMHRRDMGIFEKLSAEFRDHAAWPEQLAHSHRQWGFDLWETGRPKEGEKALRKAINVLEESTADFPRAVPSHHDLLSDTYFQLVGLLATTGQAQESEQAILEIVKVLEKHASDYPSERAYRHELGRSFNRLGILLAAARNPGEAEKAHLKALKVYQELVGETDSSTGQWHRRELARTYMNLGTLLKTGGRDKDAENAWREGLAQSEKLAADHPSDGMYLFWIAQFATGLGQFAQAEKAYAKVIELFPNGSPGAHNNLAWLLATCPDPKFRDPSKAVKLAQKAVDKARNEGNHWNTLGVTYYRAGDWKAAIESLEKSKELLGDTGLSFNAFFLAMAHWKLDQKQEAHKWYDQAVAWMEKNKPQDEELKRFRAEAEDELKIEKKPMQK